MQGPAASAALASVAFVNVTYAAVHVLAGGGASLAGCTIIGRIVLSEWREGGAERVDGRMGLAVGAVAPQRLRCATVVKST